MLLFVRLSPIKVIFAPAIRLAFRVNPSFAYPKIGMGSAFICEN